MRNGAKTFAIAGGVTLLGLIGLCAWLYSIEYAIFKHPANFVGHQVWLCGYIQDKFESRDIWRSEWDYNNAGLGLGLISGQVSPKTAMGPLHQKTRCIRAKIVRTGCGQEFICSWSSFEYAARLDGTN